MGEAGPVEMMQITPEENGTQHVEDEPKLRNALMREDAWNSWDKNTKKSRAAEILEGEPHSSQSTNSCLLRFVLNPLFETAIAGIIVLNIVFVAAELQCDGIVLGKSEGFSNPS